MSLQFNLRRVLGLACAVTTCIALARAADAQQVVTEPKRRLIPAGRGRAPFDVTRHLIPLGEIQSGGVPRNAIPALSRPHFFQAAMAEGSVNDNDRVLGIFLNGEAKAYPFRILNWHELVNDEVGGIPVLVSWCPLCGSGIVYDPVVDGRRLTFGVSGLLYKRNLQMFDTQTDSLWSQLLSKAVTGPHAGKELKILLAENTTWGEWKERHPGSRVMWYLTGHARDYGKDPYADRPLPRAPALLVRSERMVKIFPYSELRKAREPVEVDLQGHKITIVFDPQAETARVVSEAAVPFSAYTGFVRSLRDFFPDAEVYRAERKRN